MKALVIAQTSMVRTLRDRMGLFFIVVLPLILIVVLGVTYGGMGAGRIGVANLDGGALSTDLEKEVAASVANLEVRPYASESELRGAVERGFVELGLVIPPGYDEALRGGGTPRLQVVAQAKSIASVLRAPLDAAIGAQVALVRAARFTADEAGVSFEEALTAARAARPSVAGVSVSMEADGAAASQASGFTIGAHSQVILFMFLTSLTGAVPLVVSRQLGITRRMFATPTPARTIILGEGLGRFAFALFQGGFIVLASGLLFGVDWLDPLGTAAIIVSFALVATGAAMLIGSWARNESQVGAFGAGGGMMLGLLGGTMVPLAVFPEVMRTIARVTPHAWAMEGFRKMLDEGAGVLQILPEVAVLVGFAVVLIGLAVVVLRRSLTVSAA
ncbi:MAG TPA: ABC transporter permease [Candidatus Limnocylindria bacterium]